jgi:DNA-binding NarL/FixJ family response regulator
MPIYVFAASSLELTGEAITQCLREQPDILARVATGSPQEVLKQCAGFHPCVLIIGDSFLDNIDPRRFRELIDYGRAISVLVIGSGGAPEEAMSWLQLGCLGYLDRSETLATITRAVYAVAAGQFWAPRSQVADLLRHLLDCGGASSQLTGREEQILELIARGHSNREIANSLFISNETVRWHVRRLLAKIGAEDRAAAARFAQRYWAGSRFPILPRRSGRAAEATAPSSGGRPVSASAT